MESKLQIVPSFAELNAFFFFVSLTSWIKKNKTPTKTLLLDLSAEHQTPL